MGERAMARGLLCGCAVALAACGGGGGGGEEAAADIVGYYTYADPARGISHLALLASNRFLLVQEPIGAPGAAAAPAGEAAAPPASLAGGSEGAVGWYIVRGDSLYLNSERLYARGAVSAEVVRLVFVEPLVPGMGGADYEMPFQRDTATAAPSGGGGGGGGGGQGGGDGGGQ